MSNSLSLSLFVLMIVFVVGWFAAGTQFNIHRGHKVLGWLQQGLHLLGERTSLRWLGSAVVELRIAKAKEPFREAEIVLAFEPRDVPLLWWYYRIRGRCDLLIVRAQLCTQPGSEFEVFDPNSWTARELERHLQFRNWTRTQLAPASPLVAYAAGPTPPAAELLALAEQLGPALLRFALHRTNPHLEVHWSLAGVQQMSSSTALEQLRGVPRRITALH
jgi:hypothetical protein